MSTRGARFALAFAVLGFASSAAAAYIHYQLLADPTYQSVCDVSATVNCTEVYTSRFGSFGGISVSVFGTIFFALAALLASVSLRASDTVRQSVSEYLFAGSTVSLAAVFYLGYASFVILNRVCILCLVTYAAVAGLFLVSGASSSVSLLALPGRLLSDLRLMAKRPAALAVGAAFVAASVAALALFPREMIVAGTAATGAAAGDGPGGVPAGFDAWYAALPRVTLAEPAEGADLVIVKFNDYQCPPCRQTFMEYQDVFAKYQASHPGRVRYVVRDFPLESECNPLVTSDLHPASCEAAVAVRLAREQGRDQEMEDWLFANQASMTPEMVEQGARVAGGVTNFRERYAATLPAVRADVQTGIDVGARSTPTFVINGVLLAGGVPPPIFDHIIAHELERAARPTSPAAP